MKTGRALYGIQKYQPHVSFPHPLQQRVSYHTDIMETQTIHQRRGHPAIILLFVALQCIGTEFVAGPTTTLLWNMTQFVECQGNELQLQPSAPELDSCVTTAFNTLQSNWQAYGRTILLLGLVASGPLARFMDVMGPSKRGLVMAASAIIMALGDIWLYVCGEFPLSRNKAFWLTITSE